MELSTLGMRIRHYRQKIGISQRELAAAVGMSSNAVSCYEKGTREPNIATLAAFAGILQITGDTLLGLKPNPFSGAQNGKELSMLHTFRDLNETGQDKALEYIRDLSQLNVYAANNNPDTTRHDTTRHDTTRHDTTRHDISAFFVKSYFIPKTPENMKILAKNKPHFRGGAACRIIYIMLSIFFRAICCMP